MLAACGIKILIRKFAQRYTGSVNTLKHTDVKALMCLLLPVETSHTQKLSTNGANIPHWLKYHDYIMNIIF